MSTTSKTKPQLTAFIVGSVLFSLLCFAIMLPSWTTLWSIWHEKGSSYSHGTIVVLVAAWLIYDQWGHLQKQTPSTHLQTLFTVVLGLGGALTWSLGELTGISMLYWLSIPALTCALFLACTRQQATFKSIAPFIALYFALPVWELLVPSLQMLAVAVVRVGIEIIGIPAFIQGINVNIPGGRFIVEGGCSGVRYLLVAVAITSLWGYLYISSKKYTALLIFLGAVISIVTNWIRIFLIIIIGYETQMKSSIVYDHEFFGWILFAIALIPIMFIAMKLEKKAEVLPQAAAIKEKPEITPSWNLKKGIPFIVVLSALPIASQLIEHAIPSINAPSISGEIKSTAFENTQQAFRTPEDILSQSKKTLGGWRPDYSGIEMWSTFQLKPSGLQVLLGHISQQREGHELFSSTNFMEAANSSQWTETFNRNKLYLRNIYSQKWVGRVFYRVGGEMTTPGIKGKLQQLYSVHNMRNDAQLIIIGFKCQSSCAEAERQLEAIEKTDINSWLKEPSAG